MITLSNRVAFLVSLANSIGFYCFNHILKVNRSHYPRSVVNSDYHSWKWRNYLISFGHATTSSILCIGCLIINPDLFVRVVTESSDEAYLFLCFSYGYFNFDTIQMLNHYSYKGIKELILHHVVVLTLLFVAIWRQEYVGFVCTGFLMELNSSFLHLRQLLKLSGTRETSQIYRAAVCLNLGTLFVFRYGTLGWLAYRLHQERLNIVAGFSIVLAIFSITLTIIISSVLLYRLLKADLFTQGVRQPGDRARAQITFESISSGRGNKMQ